MTVKRYTYARDSLADCYCDVIESDDGEFVSHSALAANDALLAMMDARVAAMATEVEQLIARRDALESERDEARALREQYRGAMYVAENDAALVRAVWKSREAALEAENAALREVRKAAGLLLFAAKRDSWPGWDHSYVQELDAALKAAADKIGEVNGH